MLRHGLRNLYGGLRHRPWGQFAPPAAAGALGLPTRVGAPRSRSLWHRDGEESLVSRRTFDVVTIADSDSTVRAKVHALTPRRLCLGAGARPEALGPD